MQGKAVSQGFLDYVNESVTPFHAVSVSARTLISSGFERLQEHQSWSLRAGGKYFFTRNESSLFAFIIGSSFSPPESSFRIIGTHTDSPCPKLAPRSAIDSSGFTKLNVMLYGGGLWNSWFDRDLTLAGRVVVNLSDSIQTRLVHIKRPILNIPELAIHLSSNREKFEFNKESHLKPLLCSALLADTNKVELKNKSHPGALMQLIAQESGCEVEHISDLELLIIDTNPAQITGLYDEFISSPRLDNLMSCYCALQALSEAGSSGRDIQMWAAFDHEEVGSISISGADSVIMANTLGRILNVLCPGIAIDEKEQIFKKSFGVSADMAHAVHPNYSDKHHPQHAPKVHGGVVVKINADLNYASDTIGIAMIKGLAARNEVPVQEFIVKNDSACGSTIGPMLSGNTGIRVVDIGAPQLAMHSCRELMGTDDAYFYYSFMKAFYDDPNPLHDSASYQ